MEIGGASSWHKGCLGIVACVCVCVLYSAMFRMFVCRSVGVCDVMEVSLCRCLFIVLEILFYVLL